MIDLIANIGLADAVAVLTRIYPALFIVEVLFLIYTYRASRGIWLRALKLPLFIQLGHLLFGSFLYIDTFQSTHSYFAKVAPFQVSVSVLGFIYAFVVWELAHYVYHWSCHKVRLLWCLHAPHHAPEHMNLSVASATFFYEATYSVFVRTAICMALGVPMPLFILAMGIDTLWGSFIHVSEEAWKKGRLPSLLGRFIMSPIHHRVHHGSNPEYIDKNYCNTLPLWDKLFGTYQDEIEGMHPRYGVTRALKPGSLIDLYFGEFLHLAKDIAGAASLKDILLYLVMPPGWHPHQSRERICAERPATISPAASSAATPPVVRELVKSTSSAALSSSR